MCCFCFLDTMNYDAMSICLFVWLCYFPWVLTVVTQVAENQRQRRNPEISQRVRETFYLEIKTLTYTQ